MKERSLYFRGPSADAMVRAVLNGTKTQTRRPIVPQPESCDYDAGEDAHDPEWEDSGEGWRCVICGNGMRLVKNDTKGMSCPFGGPGDRLWVRECWATYSDEVDPTGGTILYRSDMSAYWDMGPHKKMVANFNPLADSHPPYVPKWRPSIHMPRWAARIIRPVKRTWIERVQDISEADCWAEGITREFSASDFQRTETCAHAAFAGLWDSTYASKGLGWSENPWVWACEFESESQ